MSKRPKQLLLLVVLLTLHSPSLSFPDFRAKALRVARTFENAGAFSGLGRELTPLRSGLTLAPCKENSECSEVRECLSDTSRGPVPCSDFSSECTCRPKKYQICQETKDCESGEACVTIESSSICVSALVAAYRQELKKPTDALGQFSYGGLTLDPCMSSDTCEAGRQCVFFPAFDTKETCAQGESCYCYPDALSDCLETSQCEKGEVCAEMEDVPSPVCVSKVAEYHIHTVSEIKGISGQNEDSSPAGSPESEDPPRLLRGVTLEQCFTDMNCLGDRKCILFEKEERLPCNGRKGCSCFPKDLKLCDSSVDCETREVCSQSITDKTVKAFCSSAVITGYSEELEEVSGGLARPDSSFSAGLTVYPCKDDAGCKASRKCTTSTNTGDLVSCGSNKDCFCFPDQPQLCTETENCRMGEVCARVENEKTKETVTICVSADVEAAAPTVVEVTRPKQHGPENPDDKDTKGPALNGVTFDPCKESDDCEGSRKCTSIVDLTACKDQNGCYCNPPERAPCASMKDCEVREVCGKRPKENGFYCLSRVFAALNPNVEIQEAGEAQQNKSKSDGLTFFPCKDSSACKGGRQCRALSDAAEAVACTQGDSCFCVPPKMPSRCGGHNQCEAGEVCTKPVADDEAPKFLPNPACIAADAVAGVRNFKPFDDDSDIPEQSGEPEDDKSPAVDGVTFDWCTDSKECAGARTCVTRAAKVPCNGKLGCICYPPNQKKCQYSKDCESREVCATLPGETESTCVSAIYANTAISVKRVPNDKPNEIPSKSAGLTMYPCSSDSQCKGARKCQTSNGKELVACNKESGCICLQNTVLCTQHSMCTPGEVCAKAGVPGASASGPANQACVAADVEASSPFLEVITIKREPIEPDGTTGGVTLDSCAANKDCSGTRTCVSSTGSHVPCKEKEGCICWPSQLRGCSSHTQCEPREVCAVGLEESKQYCLSAVMVGFSPDINKITFGPPKVQYSDSRGLTGWPCSENESICKGARQCVYEKGSSNVACVKGKTCYCFPTNPSECAKDVECEEGEVCAKAAGEDSPTALPSHLCVAKDVESSLNFLTGVTAGNMPSPTVTPSLPASATATPQSTKTPDATPSSSAAPGASASTTPTPSVAETPEDSPEATISPSITPSPSRTSSNSGSSTDGVCVDADALSHLGRDELVFEEHSLALVLCDAYNSCATPGHIVTYEGKAMMMKSYCKLVQQCEQREMLVNSPKFKIQLRVDSNTKGLQYTAFAARYETRAEEAAMIAAVRIGL